MKNVLYDTLFIGNKDLPGGIFLLSNLLAIFLFELKPIIFNLDVAQRT